MPKCPNCFYELVLLERRSKYKCAKCGKLFYQKEIDIKEFVEWNKRERKKDKETFYGKPQKQKKLTEFEKRQRALAYQRKWKEKHREEYNRQKREYWAKHREHLLQKRKENLEKRKDEILGQQKLYRENNKLLRRINNLRTEQKKLALRYYKFLYLRALNNEIQKVLPTLALS
tara:strand:+ start:60 stop:578 length:519 start_codon:yes stop_codon:yes gene_type:complete